MITLGSLGCPYATPMIGRGICANRSQTSAKARWVSPLLTNLGNRGIEGKTNSCFPTEMVWLIGGRSLVIERYPLVMTNIAIENGY